jgi:hypothetical protein
MAKNKDRVTFTWARAWRLDTFLGQAYGWNLYDLIPVEPGGSDSKYAPAAKWLTENSEKDPDIVDSFFDIIFEKPKTVGGTLVRKAAGERCSPDEMWAFLGFDGPVPPVSARPKGTKRRTMADVLAARKEAQAARQRREEAPPSEPPPAHDEPVQQLAPATAEQDKVSALEAQIAAQQAQMAQMMAMMQQMMLAQAPAPAPSEPAPEPAAEPEQEEAAEQEQEESEGIDTMGEDDTDLNI